MKRIISICLILAMICLSGAAMASVGDKTLARVGDAVYSSQSLDKVYLVGRKVYMLIYGSSSWMEVYDLDTQQTETYSLQAMQDRMNGIGQDALSGENGEIMTESVACWFEYEDGLCAVVVRMKNREDSSSIEGAYVRKLTLQDGEGDLTEMEMAPLDWSQMTENYGSWEGSRYVNGCIALGQKLHLICYDDSGNEVLMLYDLAKGEAEERYIPDLSGIAYGTSDRILVTQTRWGEKSFLIVSLYDSATEDMEELVRFDMDKVSPRNVTYDEKTGTLYYLHAGEIFALTGNDPENAVAVNDCPLSGNGFGRVVGDGFVLMGDYRTLLLRNTDPAMRSQTKLHVRPYTWSQGLDGAYYAFTSVHGDVEVVLEDYGDENALLQAMMNRDDQVDVYVMNMSASAYNAIYDRGFMADLSGSALLKARTEAMYPAIRDSLKKNEKIVAVPVYSNGNGLGYSTKVWKALGFTDADLPATWDQFFDLLETLPEKTEGTAYRAFETYTTKETFRGDVMQEMLAQYTLCAQDQPYNTPELRRLLDRLDKVDYEALGMMTDEETMQMQDDYSLNMDYKEGLFTTYAPVNLQNYSSGSQALRLALQEGEEAVLPFELSVAWVNPYSKYQEEAVAFLESLVDSVDPGTRYTMSAEGNEPIRYPDHEETKKNIEKWINEARKNLENAEDEETTSQWERVLHEYETELQTYDETHWMLSPADIEGYHTRAENVRPIRWNLMQQMYSGDESENFYMIYEGYMNGQKTAEELLSYIDRKVQMMRLEGN
ncbi:MAG: carbohydrate ABC transporter substrate-binding protein [Clostridia bacterium]|nr:carbohydrate ABC transporter substrate-binding protein [Clostridia bacterium]